MTESEWLASEDPQKMLDYLKPKPGHSATYDLNYFTGTVPVPFDNILRMGTLAKISNRKLSRFAAACVELNGFDNYDWEEVGSLKQVKASLEWAKVCAKIFREPKYAALFRDIVGNPFGLLWIRRSFVDSLPQDVSIPADRFGFGFAMPPLGSIPVKVFEDKWLTWNNATVPKLAQTIYDERAFELMPMMADALEDAGCDNADILAHCRGKERCPLETENGYHGHDNCQQGWINLRGPHVRGCWVLDLILGTE